MIRRICLAILMSVLLILSVPITRAQADASASATNNADASQADKEGMTPFMGAAAAGRIDLMQGLLDKGVDVTAQSKTGNTALIYASYAPHPPALTPPL